MSMPTAAEPDAVTFQELFLDSTCCCEALFCGSTKLHLGPDEVELEKTICLGCCHEKRKGPYGELGSVETQKVCGIFFGWSANSLMKNPEDVQCIGLGCDKGAVDTIVNELKERQKYRGDRAKVRMAESTLNSLRDLHQKVDRIMDHLGIAPGTEDMSRGGTDMAKSE
ncbi:Hypothetical protein (Fragment) [Durusdinium trenchii]|uniref:Uncharacterized protein n=1 Tax=Durusdinium trenchii TaxID=1381693 RepID=A0ABP0SLY6_9DINO